MGSTEGGKKKGKGKSICFGRNKLHADLQMMESSIKTLINVITICFVGSQTVHSHTAVKRWLKWSDSQHSLCLIITTAPAKSSSEAGCLSQSVQLVQWHDLKHSFLEAIIFRFQQMSLLKYVTSPVNHQSCTTDLLIMTQRTDVAYQWPIKSLNCCFRICSVNLSGAH